MLYTDRVKEINYFFLEEKINSSNISTFMATTGGCKNWDLSVKRADFHVWTDRGLFPSI